MNADELYEAVFSGDGVYAHDNHPENAAETVADMLNTMAHEEATLAAAMIVYNLAGDEPGEFIEALRRHAVAARPDR